MARPYFAKGAREKRTLAKVPNSELANVSEHEAAKVVGMLAYIGEPLISPLTGRSCAYFDIRVEQYVSFNGQTDWTTIIHESKGQNFILEDGTDHVIVDPTGAKVGITVDSHTESKTFDDPTDRERSYLASQEKDGESWNLDKTTRYREGILEAGELVAVLGRGVREPDPEGVAKADGFRATPPMRLRMRGSQNVPLVISDDAATLN